MITLTSDVIVDLKGWFVVLSNTNRKNMIHELDGRAQIEHLAEVEAREM